MARDIPFPPDAGDKIYSGRLARALSDAGAYVRFLGFALSHDQIPANWPVQWVIVPGPKHSMRKAFCSFDPIQAALHCTPEYRRLLDTQLLENWDAIIFDSYGSGWAFRYLQSISSAKNADRPVYVYVAHNHETQLWRNLLGAARSGFLRRIGIWQNYLKTRKMEKYLVANADLVTAITEEDALALARYKPNLRSVVLTPGYFGAAAQPRVIDESMARRVVTLGSFRWLIKQENLKLLISAADAIFFENNIVLDIVGDVPRELIEKIGPHLKAVHFHGFVVDPSQIMRHSRIAIVPELVGGGFKLKFLDYIFNRVPIATLADATVGLPQSLRQHMLLSRDLDALVSDIVANISNTKKLTELQASAFDAANQLFRWEDRGLRLAAALINVADTR